MQSQVQMSAQTIIEIITGLFIVYSTNTSIEYIRETIHSEGYT